MSTRNIALIADKAELVDVPNVEERARLNPLQGAVRVGVADIEARRFESYASAAHAAEHLATTAEARIRSRSRRK